MFDLIDYKTLFKKKTNNKTCKNNKIRLKKEVKMAKEFAKKFYKSTAWIKSKNSYIKSVHGLCERCEKPGYIVHHKIHLNPNNINDPEISLNHDNLEYLCLDCHNEHHDFEREKKPITRNGFKFNDKGELVKA